MELRSLGGAREVGRSDLLVNESLLLDFDVECSNLLPEMTNGYQNRASTPYILFDGNRSTPSK